MEKCRLLEIKWIKIKFYAELANKGISNQLTPYVQFREPVMRTPLAFVPSIKQNLLCINFSFSPDTRTGIPDEEENVFA